MRLFYSIDRSSSLDRIQEGEYGPIEDLRNFYMRQMSAVRQNHVLSFVPAPLSSARQPFTCEPIYGFGGGWTWFCFSRLHKLQVRDLNQPISACLHCSQLPVED